MRSTFVRPSSWKGWLMLVAFISVIVAGIWPVVGWVNQAVLVLGLPKLLVWSYIVLMCCTLVMWLGNMLVGEGEHD
ncbi:hypothetical protein [Halomonas huangheensis]|uniref:Uncharacterized protein n=1 Tax=Halomonas huangheensis TaxID=1178482 RepID=W1N8B0_9GAMM|nr:hypothetical protein [Halomonas huangheensis]ALM51086.1 hypothetical protein AR456_01330 [Halomonas huangheensis]ERL51160.1 hypothetical protein BJB45_14750 [Halomonas huangheensis]